MARITCLATATSIRLRLSSLLTQCDSLDEAEVVPGANGRRPSADFRYVLTHQRPSRPSDDWQRLWAGLVQTVHREAGACRFNATVRRHGHSSFHFPKRQLALDSLVGPVEIAGLPRDDGSSIGAGSPYHADVTAPRRLDPQLRVLGPLVGAEQRDVRLTSSCRHVRSKDEAPPPPLPAPSPVAHA